MRADLPEPKPLAPERRPVLDGIRAEARAALDRGDAPEARRLAAEVLAEDPTDPLARALLGVALSREARAENPPILVLWRRAEGELLRAEALAPIDPEVAILHAGFLLDDGHLSAAAARLEPVLAASPRHPELLATLGRILFDLGDVTPALDVSIRRLALVPDDAEAQWRVAACHASLADTTIDRDERRNHLAAAATAYARHAELAPEDPDSSAGEAWARFTLALEGGPADAETYARIAALWTRVAELRPISPEGPFGVGRVLEQAGDPEAAEPRYEEALSRDPNHVPSLLALAALRVTDERAEQAVPLLRRALELDLTSDERESIVEWLAGH